MFSLICALFHCREFTVETEGKTFQLTKDMVSVKRFQKTLHGKFVKIINEQADKNHYCLIAFFFKFHSITILWKIWRRKWILNVIALNLVNKFKALTCFFLKKNKNIIVLILKNNLKCHLYIFCDRDTYEDYLFD